MYIELNTKSRSLGGVTDLTLIAPIKQGLVPSLDSITYKTRVRRLLAALQGLRESSHEYSLFRSISDSSERVGRIHSFRVAVLEPGDHLLLAVTFDGARESYVRVLWQKIGTLLDLLFCSTEGHVPSHGNSLAAWDAWIERVQVKTDFFYGRPRVSSDDVVFLGQEEREHRGQRLPLAADLASARRAVPEAEAVAWSLMNDGIQQLTEAGRQAVQSLVALHRLTAWFIPDTPEGGFLHRAARDLLPEFVQMTRQNTLFDPALDEARIRFPEQVGWFLNPCPERTAPPAPKAAPDDALKRRIQGGILESYERVTHGALLLLAFRPGADAAPFWALVSKIRTAAYKQPITGEKLICNVYFTPEGLRAAGLNDSELAEFPLEFREGMEARSSVLGDFRTNHPRRWRLPLRNWSGGGGSAASGEAVELGAVHVVLQLRIGNPRGMPAEARCHDLTHTRHPLREAIDTVSATCGRCMELLSMEPMVRHLDNPTNPASQAKEHFGFVDGDGQPVLDPAKNGRVYTDNLVHPGEFIVGLANASDPPAGAGTPEVSPWLRDGSFLVLRKLAQDVELFEKIIADGAAATGLAADTVAAKLMGRTKAADPLAVPGAGNDFDYTFDPLGQSCPMQAHIRRANPRVPVTPAANTFAPPPGGRPPRIMRRSMSYGPVYDRVDTSNPANKAPRGIVFMAYNARIAEQFEVVQRWLVGGNSTGGLSGRSDFLVGVPESGEQRVFAFECPVTGAKGAPVATVHRVQLDGNANPAELARTMVQLEWGAYLFTPSLRALEDLGRRAAEKVAPQWPWSADRGRAEIARLQALPCDADRVSAWKAALEDPDAQKNFLSASIWAAIRRDFNGVLGTPYGVLAASHAQASAVLADARGRYSVGGYRERTAPTLGDIYLGLDDHGPGCPYRAKSAAPNAAIHTRVSRQAAFDQSLRLARDALATLVRRENEAAWFRGEDKWQLTFGAKEVWDETLEGLCRLWFGLPAAGASALIQPGNFRWDWDPRSAVRYPGNFVSPSRYIFQPQPGAEVRRIGAVHGTTMNAAFCAWVKELRDAGSTPKAPDGSPAVLAQAIFEAFPRETGGDAAAHARQDGLVAETLLGALIGFLPTVEGNLRQSLNEWLLDDTFWALRASPDPTQIEAALRRSMQLRPSPEVVWRRATTAHALGDVAVRNDETVVVGIVSATHELIERGSDDVSPVFGGTRTPGAGHPTHACPGYGIAIGTLLGIVTALLEVKGSIRPAPSPLSFRREGTVSVPPGRSAPPSRAAPAAPRPPLAKTPGAGRVLLVAGDSWLNYIGYAHNFPQAALGTCLAQQGFEVVNLAQSGKSLAKMAANDLDALCAKFRGLVQQGKTPAAILLSAGGNDVIDKILLSYVLPFRHGAGGLDEAPTLALMDGQAGAMRAQVRKILDRLGKDCCVEVGVDRLSEPVRVPVPVLWQAYDHPIPDGRSVFGPPENPRSWLYPSLLERGYVTLDSRFALMREVVDRYNRMLAGIAAEDTYRGRFVHADLRGTLLHTLAGDAYQREWANEMHPTPAGFEKLAQRLVDDHLLPTLARAAKPAAKKSK